MPNENTEGYYADYEVIQSNDISDIVNSPKHYGWVDRMTYAIKKWVVGMSAAAILLGAVATTNVSCKPSETPAWVSYVYSRRDASRPADAGVRDTFKGSVYGSNTNPETGTPRNAPSTTAPHTPTAPVTPNKTTAPETPAAQENDKGDLELRLNMHVDSTRFRSNTAKKNIEKFVRDAYKAGKKAVYVAGFASIEGPSDKGTPVKNNDPYNEKLSELRTEKVGGLVAKYLQKKGIHMKVLQIHYGETDVFGGLPENRTVALSTRQMDDPNESKKAEEKFAGMPAEVVYDTAKAPKGEVTIDASKVKVYKLKQGKAGQSRSASRKQQQAAESRLEKATVQPAATQEPQLPDSVVQIVKKQEAKVRQFTEETTRLERLGDKYNRLRAMHNNECRPGALENTICDTKAYGRYCVGGEPKSIRGEPAACTYLYKDLVKMYADLQSRAKSQTQRLEEVRKETHNVQKLLQQYRKATQRKSAPQNNAPSQNHVPDHSTIERDDGVIIKFHNPAKKTQSPASGGISSLDDRCRTGVYQYSHLLDSYMGKCVRQGQEYGKSA